MLKEMFGDDLEADTEIKTFKDSPEHPTMECADGICQEDPLTRTQNKLNEEACDLFGPSLSELASQDAQHVCDNNKASSSIVILQSKS
jgi:hypothetical protein